MNLCWKCCQLSTVFHWSCTHVNWFHEATSRHCSNANPYSWYRNAPQQVDSQVCRVVVCAYMSWWCIYGQLLMGRGQPTACETWNRWSLWWRWFSTASTNWNVSSWAKRFVLAVFACFPDFTVGWAAGAMVAQQPTMSIFEKIWKVVVVVSSKTRRDTSYIFSYQLNFLVYVLSIERYVLLCGSTRRCQHEKWGF